MAIAAPVAPARSVRNSPVTLQQYLAPNVIRLFAEERPPVQQDASRRGRWPNKVERLAHPCRLKPGVLCRIEYPHESPYNGLVVLLIYLQPNGNYGVEILGWANGRPWQEGRRYGSVQAPCLRRGLFPAYENHPAPPAFIFPVD